MGVLHVLDLLGTFVFAVSGAFKAVKYELDFLGVMVLAVATGVGGGILRDLLLGAAPPAALLDEKYLILCLLGGGVVIAASRRIATHWDWVLLADAVGLGVFAAIGAAKGADYGLGWVGILITGALTASGGGVVRDILVCEIPAVLRADFYASAALIGAALLVAARAMGATVNLQIALAASSAIVVRFIAMRYSVSLPRVHKLPESPTELAKHRKSRKRRKNNG